jgi:hypothetical protein
MFLLRPGARLFLLTGTCGFGSLLCSTIFGTRAGTVRNNVAGRAGVRACIPIGRLLSPTLRLTLFAQVLPGHRVGLCPGHALRLILWCSLHPGT